jgi:hypothetical protein
VLSIAAQAAAASDPNSERWRIAVHAGPCGALIQEPREVHVCIAIEIIVALQMIIAPILIQNELCQTILWSALVANVGLSG